MAKIPRKTQVEFAKDSINTGQFGSGADNTKVLSKDLDVLQANPAYLEGWIAAVIGNKKFPALEEFEAIGYIATQQIGYILQEGIPEYDAGTTYYTNSIVKKSGTYEIYGSLINDNTGNPLPDAVSDANWEFLQDLSLDYGIPYGVSTSTGNAYSVSTSPTFSNLVDGSPVFVKIDAENTGAATLNPNSTLDVPIVMDGSALIGGEMKADAIYAFIYDSVDDVYHLLGGQPVYADNAQTQAGVLTDRAVTPAGLASLTATDARRGLIELATSAEVMAGLDTDRAITPAAQKAAVGFTRVYDSGNLNWNTGVLVSEAHGLGVTPFFAVATLVCVSAQGGYAVGDEIPITTFLAANSGGRSFGYNSTEIFACLGMNPYGNYVAAKTPAGATSGVFTPSPANWRIRFKAWA